MSEVEKDYSKLNSQSIYLIASIMPDIYNTYKNAQNPNYQDVIINKFFKDKLITILNTYKNLSNDSRYLSIINNLITDLHFLENKKRDVVIGFMEM